MTKTEKTALKIGAIIALLVVVAVIAYKSGSVGYFAPLALWR